MAGEEEEEDRTLEAEGVTTVRDAMTVSTTVEAEAREGDPEGEGSTADGTNAASVTGRQASSATLFLNQKEKERKKST